MSGVLESDLAEIGVQWFPHGLMAEIATELERGQERGFDRRSPTREPTRSS